MICNLPVCLVCFVCFVCFVCLSHSLRDASSPAILFESQFRSGGRAVGWGSGRYPPALPPAPPQGYSPRILSPASGESTHKTGHSPPARYRNRTSTTNQGRGTKVPSRQPPLYWWRRQTNPKASQQGLGHNRQPNLTTRDIPSSSTGYPGQPHRRRGYNRYPEVSWRSHRARRDEGHQTGP